MSTIKRFSILDFLEYNKINMDILTETFGDSFYGQYILKWSEFCFLIR